ncbi:MAG: hypothetical protein D6775_13495 [Caldilineae bacterium]|nr:MAG: hypothetical protein D6775_13495 [Caldilineae bacterium]
MELRPDRPSYRRDADPDAWTPVLVAVVNNEADFARARDEHWYRIPVKRAPRQIAAEYLALYQTGRFAEQGRRINYYAPILRYHLATRAELLPDQPDHPRARDQYFKLELGELIRLPRPIPNHRQPRLTFIYTTLERLLNAREVNDLWLRAAARQKLYAAIRERGLAVECWYPVEMGDRPEADLALFGPHGRLTVYIEEPGWEEPGTQEMVWERGADGGLVYHCDALAILREPNAVLGKLLAG